jgi:hypothetical protein
VVAATTATSGFVVAWRQLESIWRNIWRDKIRPQKWWLGHLGQAMQREKKQNDGAGVNGQRDRLRRPECRVFLPDFIECCWPGRGLPHLSAGHSKSCGPYPFLQVFLEAVPET